MTPRLETPIPKRIRTLPKDARGYPIPFLVMIDGEGKPQFTINDERRARDCITKNLCAICGKRFDVNRADGILADGRMRYDLWFVGGSRCFLHERGAFLDPPLHLECAEYALRVCPFLAAPRYSKRIDDSKLKVMPEGTAIVRHDYMPPSLPERFGLGLCHNYQFQSTSGLGGLFVVSDWRYVEWWRAGQPCETPDTGEPPPPPSA